MKVFLVIALQRKTNRSVIVLSYLIYRLGSLWLHTRPFNCSNELLKIPYKIITAAPGPSLPHVYEFILVQLFKATAI